MLVSGFSPFSSVSVTSFVLFIKLMIFPAFPLGNVSLLCEKLMLSVELVSLFKLSFSGKALAIVRTPLAKVSGFSPLSSVSVTSVVSSKTPTIFPAFPFGKFN